MSFFLRGIMVIGAALLMIVMTRMIRQSKLKIQYSIFWLAFSVLLVGMGSFPQLFYFISEVLGLRMPMNGIYLIIILILIVKLFLMTIQIADLENKVDILVQRVAIDRKLEKEKERGDAGIAGIRSPEKVRGKTEEGRKSGDSGIPETPLIEGSRDLAGQAGSQD